MEHKDNGATNLLNINVAEHKIMSMKEEKRTRIINAALEEFAKGYERANTDIIVQNSGISKGLLFYHFGTKKDLFLFLVKYSEEITSAEFQKESFESRDYLENIWKLSLLSSKLSLKYPLLYSFMVPAVFYMKEEFPKEFVGYNNPVDEILSKAFKNYDPTLFRDGLDIPKVCNIIMWTLKGYSDSLLEYGKSVEDYRSHFEKIEKEFAEYIELLRKTFYK